MLQVDHIQTSRAFLKGLLKEMHENGVMHANSLCLVNVTLESLYQVIKDIQQPALFMDTPDTHLE